MTRHLSYLVFALALAVTLAFPVEDVAKVDDVKIPEPVVVADPEVHEPVPAQPEVPIAEPVVPSDVPKVEEPLPIKEGPKEQVPLDFKGFDSDNSGYIDVAEWELKADADKKDKFDQVDIDDDARISEDEFKNIPVPALEPQENVNDVYVPAEVSDQQAVDKPVDLPIEDLAVAPVGRSAEAAILPAAVAEAEVAPIDTVVVPEVVEVVKPDEPVPAASGEQAVAVVDEAAQPKPIIEDAVVPVEELKPAVAEERADVSFEDVDEPVREQKDPILSDDIKSSEVKSDEEAKSQEVKSEEVSSEEVKKEEPKIDLVSEPVVQPEVPQAVVKEPEVVKEVIKEPEVAKESVEESEAQKEPVKEENKVKDEAKEDVKKDDKIEDKVKEVAKVEEPVKVEEVVQPEAVKKPEEVSKDLSPSNQIRM